MQIDACERLTESNKERLDAAMDGFRQLGATFSGFATLIRFGDTSNAGMTVTFKLDEKDDIGHVYDVHPFKGLLAGAKDGARFRLIAVLDDLQDAVSSPPASGSTATAEQGEGRKSLAQSAGIMCADPEFFQYMQDHGYIETYDVFTADEERAAGHLRDYLGIESRAELDTDPVAAQTFKELRSGFWAWKALGEME